MIIDNSENPSKIIAEGFRNIELEIYDQKIYSQIIPQ
jgi:hypothetical protein